MDTARIAIVATPLGGRITINDQDVTDRVAATELRIVDGQPTVLTVHLAAEGTIEGQGIIHIIEPQGSPVELIRGFLDAVDIPALEQRVLETSDWGDTPGTGFIAALKELLQ